MRKALKHIGILFLAFLMLLILAAYFAFGGGDGRPRA